MKSGRELLLRSELNLEPKDQVICIAASKSLKDLLRVTLDAFGSRAVNELLRIALERELHAINKNSKSVRSVPRSR